MKTMRLGSLVAAVVFLVPYSAPTMARIGLDGPNGFIVNMNATFEPVGDHVPSGATAANQGRVHRFVMDEVRQRYFAYDLVMAAVGSDKLRVSVEPPSLSAAELAKVQFIGQSWTAIPLPKYPVLPEVTSGDTLVVDLLQTPVTGQRYVDNIVFTRRARSN